jgi:hypothetical protein
MENVIIALVAFTAGVITTKLLMAGSGKASSENHGGGSVDLPKDNNEHQTV